MIIILVLTAGYQILLNEAFGPLLRYLPITLEDAAIKRDEEFERAQHARLGLTVDDDDEEDNDEDNDGKNLERHLSEHERQERHQGQNEKGIELKSLDTDPEGRTNKFAGGLLSTPKIGKKRPSWADRSPKANRRSKYFGVNSATASPTIKNLREKMAEDAEAQGPEANKMGQALFAGIHDELEDLTPDERDQLVQRAFQHEALRAKRPVIWIPRDDIGVSNDEVYRTQRFSKHIWISNEYQALDGKCRAIFSRSPPDFSEVDLIQL
jgi:hypothetical protein